MRTRTLILIIGAFALLAAACATESSPNTEVRPFTEVQASEVSFENDPTFPGRAIFRVTTTEPLICAIVWGETEALGNFNNSLNMNGTGIVQHDVFLPGAEAGGTFFYRLQGSASDGTLYQSDLMTFTLSETDGAPPADAAPDHGENLAESATVVDVSSEFSAAWAGTNAVDGDLTTEWSTAGDADDAFITIDLGSAQEIAGVEFLTRTMADGSATTTTFLVTVDGGEQFGPFAAGTPANPEFNTVSFTGRVLRFDVESSTGGNTGAIEIFAFAPGSTADNAGG